MLHNTLSNILKGPRCDGKHLAIYILFIIGGIGSIFCYESHSWCLEWVSNLLDLM